MHRTAGDGYVTIGGKNFYADEDPPTRAATQLRHQEMNAIQEEIATVIESTGQALNPATETYAQMNQLNTAIDSKIANEAALRINGDAAEAGLRAAGDASLQSQISSLLPPKGFIKGFNYQAERIIWPDTAPVYGGFKISVGEGACTAQNDPTKFIVNSTSLTKKILDETTGLFVAFAPGALAGCVDPNYSSFLREFTADTADGSPILTDILSTAALYPGDLLHATGDSDVFKRSKFRKIVSKTSTTVTVDQPAAKTVNDVSMLSMTRWYYVFALGKTSDPAAFDIGINPVNDASYFVSQGWNLYRRIGVVLIDMTYDTNPTGVPLFAYEDEVYFDKWGGSGQSCATSSFIASSADRVFTLDIPALIPLKVDLAIQFHFGYESTDGVYTYRIGPVVPGFTGTQGASFYIYTKQFVISAGQAGYQTAFPSLLIPANSALELKLVDGSVNTAHTAQIIVNGFKDLRQ